jgi:nitrate/TMAO reductase-like tetraheme cytochrome c subunit
MKFQIPTIPKLSKGTWAILVVILLIVVAVPALGLVRFTTSHPIFCMTCHENLNTPEMWLASRVHPESVGCTDCHTSVSLAGIFPRKFSANDELMNSKCVACHKEIPKGEQTDIKTVRYVKISHKAHKDLNVMCVDCHRNVVHDTQSPRTNRPRMEACYGCHLGAHPRDQACDKCHPINLVSGKGKSS